jgi:hypothetical protein
MRKPKLYLALTKGHRERGIQKSGEDWAEAGFVEIRPGHFMLPIDLTAGQRRSVAAGNRIHPAKRFGWTVIRARGKRYDLEGLEINP